MALFGNAAFGVDMGTGRTTMVSPGEGILLSESSRVLVNADNRRDVYCVGEEARAMQGRAEDGREVVSPVACGAVADEEMAALLVLALAEKAAGRKKPFEKGTLLCAMPCALTRVETAALYRAMSATGARRVLTLRSAAAAALGAGDDFLSPKGRMCVLLGAGVTEIAVLGSGEVLAARMLRGGGEAIDEAIVNWFWREKDIIIGMRTAERIKRELGCATLPEDEAEEEPVLLKGRRASTAKPDAVEITRQDVRRAMEAPLQRLVDAMRSALLNVPAELSGDLMESGVRLSGGGALLEGLSDRLSAETGMPYFASEEPASDVAAGLLAALSDDKLLQGLLKSGAADEG